MFKKFFIFFIFINFIYSADEDKNKIENRIIVTGSTTILPFAMEVSKRFSNNGSGMVPFFRAKGTKPGFSTFCRGDSDINMASSRMGVKKRKSCKGVQYIEIQIGYDAIALIIRSGLSFNVTRKSLYYALANLIPVNGKLVPNDILFWKDVLKDKDTSENAYSGKIQFYGPPPSSGTLASFIDLTMYYVGNKLPTLSEYRIKNTKNYVQLMTQFRESVWTTTKSGQQQDIISEVLADDGAVGIVSYNSYLKAQDSLDVLSVDGFAYSPSNLKTRRYPLVRPLYLYVNVAKVKKSEDIASFIEEFLSDEALSSKGYLTKMGLLQLTQDQLQVSRRFVRYLKRVGGSSQ